MKLGEILIRRRIVSPQQIEQVLNQQLIHSQLLGELLIDFEVISREDLTAALQEQRWRREGFWVIN